MAYQWPAGDVRTTRQHRASTEPGPSKPAIPPCLTPGYRHHTFSAGTNTLTNALLCFGPTTLSPSTGTNPGVKSPATAYTSGGDCIMNPSPYRFQPAPSPLLPQSIVPPLPPKAPFKMSPTIAPTLPPKLPPSIPPPPPPPPPKSLPPPVLPRSQSQPPLLMPRRASAAPHILPPPPLLPTPPPPTPPPKPMGARSPSLPIMRSPDPQALVRPNVSPSAKHSSIVQEPIEPSPKSPVEGSPEMNEDEELALALKLSEQDERERENALRLAQEEDLRQAMKQSLIDSAPRPGPLGPRPGPSSSTLDDENVPSSSSMILRDIHPRSPKPVSRHATLLAIDAQVKEDEELARELARKLEAEFDSERSSPTSETNQRLDSKSSESPPLPRYPDIVGKETGTR